MITNFFLSFTLSLIHFNSDIITSFTLIVCCFMAQQKMCSNLCIGSRHTIINILLGNCSLNHHHHTQISTLYIDPLMFTLYQIRVSNMTLLALPATKKILLPATFNGDGESVSFIVKRRKNIESQEQQIMRSRGDFFLFICFLLHLF